VRFQSESPFLDQEALEFLHPSDGEPDEAEEAAAPIDWEEAPQFEGETRRPGRFRLRAGDQAAEPRRERRTLSHEALAGSGPDELEEESETSLPGYSSRYLDRRSEISGAEFEEGPASDELELREQGETAAWGQLQLQADDPAAEPFRRRLSSAEEDAEGLMEDPTSTLEQLQEGNDSSE
jgi:hypothetical protein